MLVTCTVKIHKYHDQKPNKKNKKYKGSITENEAFRASSYFLRCFILYSVVINKQFKCFLKVNNICPLAITVITKALGEPRKLADLGLSEMIKLC